MDLFSRIGIDASYIIIVLIIGLIVLGILLYKMNNQMKDYRNRLNRFMRGSKAESLEEELLARADAMSSAIEKSDRNAEDIESICRSMCFAFQKFAIVKYDAFESMGGKLSFSLCMLTDNNDGFILSSVHNATEGCYTYIKEIIRGESYVLLSEDEKAALEQAKVRKSVLDE